MLPDPRVTLLTFLLAFWLAFLLASSRTASFRSIGYPCEFKHLSVGKHFAMSLIFCGQCAIRNANQSASKRPNSGGRTNAMKDTHKNGGSNRQAFLGVTDHIHRGIANVMPYVTRDAFAFSKKQSHFRSLRRRKKPRHAEPENWVCSVASANDSFGWVPREEPSIAAQHVERRRIANGSAGPGSRTAILAWLLKRLVGLRVFRHARHARLLSAERANVRMGQNVFAAWVGVSLSMSRYLLRPRMSRSAISWCCRGAMSGMHRASCLTQT